ncbi:MAG: hypothetical protein ACXVGO_17515 [Mycobacterium sp.]
MSRGEAKKARRDKRRAKRGANWVPDTVMDSIVEDIDLAEYLEHFHELVTQRGWTYDDENSTDDNLVWFYEPSVGSGAGTYTTVWVSADDDADFVYLLLTDTSEGYQFEPEAFVERLDAIEAYRVGDPLPAFD